MVNPLFQDLSPARFVSEVRAPRFQVEQAIVSRCGSLLGGASFL